jgi:DNA-binding NarL/FixJ family response regulator
VRSYSHVINPDGQNQQLKDFQQLNPSAIMESVVQSATTTIAIIEDSTVMRERLRELYLSIPGIDVVGIAGTVSGARELIAATRPAIVSLDLWLEDGSSLDLIPFLRETYPETAIIVVTQHAEAFFRKKVRNAGAAYFVDKAEVFTVLPEIIGEYIKNSGDAG